VRDEAIDLARARERIARVDDGVPILVGGRDPDHLQGLFRRLYDLLDGAGKRVEWASWDYPEHAYQWGPRRTGEASDESGDVRSRGGYDLDPVQRDTIETMVAFVAEHV
jgi:hypothetical protein